MVEQFPPEADQPPAGAVHYKNKFMYFVYVLRSLKNNKRYIGQTSKDVLKRLREHSRGCNKWTRENRPFRLIHEEEFSTRSEAIKRERFLKSGQGRKWLDENIDN
jgi:putative endonuclease